MNHSSGFFWESAAISHPGKIRSINEDAYGDFPEKGLWVVADGVGGHHAGDFASRSIIEGFSELQLREKMSDYVDDFEDQILAINRMLVEKAEQQGPHLTIGSTVVALIMCKRHCVCLWAGDSRAYLLRSGNLHSLTRDHSRVEEMIEEGLILREDADSHPASNIITRAVGANKSLKLDLGLLELQDGDRYLLCSDGLYKEISEEELKQELRAAGDCHDVCDRLLQRVLERDARDNVTAIVIDIKAKIPI